MPGGLINSTEASVAGTEGTWGRVLEGFESNTGSVCACMCGVGGSGGAQQMYGELCATVRT